MRKLLLLTILLSLAACGNSPGSHNLVPPAADYSGSYHMIFSGTPNWTLTLTQADSDMAASIDGEGMTIDASGTVSGNRVDLTAEVPDMGTMTIMVQFAGDAQSFEGGYSFSPPGHMYGSVIGQVADWATYDASGGLPQFVQEEYIGMSRMEKLSRFRSGAGHDFSDDFESCRSMKHYYVPASDGSTWSTIPVYSPADTEVVGVDLEYIGADPAGYKLALESTDNPGIYFTIFHMTPDTAPLLGDTFAAGQLIGTHIGNVTSSDIAVGIYNTGSQWLLASFFDVMTDAFFTDNYVTPNANILSRADLIISKAERDADPLTCDGETFTPGGSLPDYVILGP